MKTLKVIIGIVVGFFATITMFQMFNEESGAGLYGALTGYAVIITICIWLVYSGSKDSTTQTNNQNNNFSLQTSDKLTTLKQLKEKGILTEQEYDEKLLKVETDGLQNRVKESKEYKQIKELHNEGILTNEEFERKTADLVSNIKSIQKNIIGEWSDNSITFTFNKDNTFNYSKEDTTLNGIWYFKNTGTIILKHNSATSTLTIIKITDNLFTYKNVNTIFNLEKI